MNWEKSMRGAQYHVAGRVVAAYHHGHTITSVTPTADGWRANWRRAACGGPPDARKRACVTLAGQLADRLASWGEMCPKSWEQLLGEDTEEPHGNSLALLEALEEMAADPYEARSLEAAYRDVVEASRHLVSERWPAIEAVARALERDGYLDGPEVIKIIEQSRRHE